MLDTICSIFASEDRVLHAEALGAREDLEAKDAGSFRIGRLNTLPSQEIPSQSALIALVDDAMKSPESFFQPAAADPAAIWNEKSVSFRSLGGDASREDIVTAEFSRRPRSANAAILIPHWNARSQDYLSIAGLLDLCGIATCVVTLPHHDTRGTGGPVANEFLNADLSAVLNSIRQSVIDVRVLTEILRRHGFGSISLIGISLGSCIAALTAAFEPNVESASLILTAGDFADVVWEGLATRHIRRELQGHLSLSDLRRAWRIISPSSFVEKLAVRKLPILIILGKYDEVVPFGNGKLFLEVLRGYLFKVRGLCLSCGHYTLSMFPFNIISFLNTIVFIRRCVRRLA